ncbi:3-deoxy-D-manno-octulosonic acid kinase [Dokdonella fugitiva]|jgi:3-deoxy-D-manno-octulosonic acid kinase|uniref:3-deoxy-D-manno-octulosonic acid kinase n=1 Tax=Dokdonella fugitiva TaxID=328517 RepID=A0A4R2I0Z5_9GAMM|nr:3-deoxy-D-manno-octulosonic acid kinase [Dokdonella fugitiva]MBA8883021.1 3-deoxy-D-manno-octulosonic acid kinase [Dokdonella fugitiva]TCO36588.1 3-deoxy-D-manno-octulosonic acid kinase [Dokdonella fugitiva]
MIEAQVQSTADGAIVYDAALGAVPTVEWFDAAHWGLLGRAAGGRGGVVFVDTPAGACALRHYHRGGLAARLSADVYVWTGAARTRAFREFDLLARLADRHLPVSLPVAACYRRDGLGYRADLLTRRIEGTETLAARLLRGEIDALLAQRIGGTIARFHLAGACHADLNAHNILVAADGGVSLIDFDRGRLRKPHFSWQQANLARLLRSLRKLGAGRLDGFEPRFWHPLLAAYHDAMARRALAGPEPAP